MCRRWQMGRIRFQFVSVVFLSAGTVQSVHAAEATRDLSGYTAVGVTFTVSIAIDAPAGTVLVGIEEAPPVNWSVTTISDGGTRDAQTGKVKWGPFFAPSIPTGVSYEVGPAGNGTGEHCFDGSISSESLTLPIDGDQCIDTSVPAVSQWGVVALTLLTLTAGTILIKNVRLSP